MEQDSSRIAVADTLELAEQSSHLDEEKAAKSSAEDTANAKKATPISQAACYAHRSGRSYRGASTTDTWNARYHVSRRSYVSPVNHPSSVNYMNWSRHGGYSRRRG